MLSLHLHTLQTATLTPETLSCMHRQNRHIIASNDDGKGITLTTVLDDQEVIWKVPHHQLRLRAGYFILTHEKIATKDSFEHCDAEKQTAIFLPASILKNPDTAEILPNKIIDEHRMGIMTHLFDTLHRADEELMYLMAAYCKSKNEHSAYQQYILKGIGRWLFHYQSNTIKSILSVKALKNTTKLEIFKRVQLAKDYIISNFESITCLDEIARACSLAPSHLLKHYSSVFSLTPHQHIIALRIEFARQLLQNTNYPVYEIMERVGCKNLSSFIRLFRRATGYTPISYRLFHQKQHPS